MIPTLVSGSEGFVKVKGSGQKKQMPVMQGVVSSVGAAGAAGTASAPRLVVRLSVCAAGFVAAHLRALVIYGWVEFLRTTG